MLSAFLLVMFSINLYGQYPPVLGPPEAGPNSIPVQIVNIRNAVDSIFRDSIMPELNRLIDEKDIPVQTKLVYSFKQGRPAKTKTEYTDRPNEEYISIPFYFTYTLKLKNLPNRRIYQKLIVRVSCFNWHNSNGGTLKISAFADVPVLEDLDVLDEMADAVVSLLNYAFRGETTSVTGYIREYMPGKITRDISLPVVPPPCNCLSIKNNGTEYAGDEYNSSFFEFQYKAPQRRIVNNQVSVSLKQIRRLNARDEGGNILYDSLENITLEFYANHQFYRFQTGPMNTGQSVALPENTLTVGRPGQNGKLLFIANIIQPGYTITDTRFSVYDRAAHFGHGTRKLIVRKKYMSKPFRLPNGQLSKPKEMSADAYELTFTVHAITETGAARREQ